MFSVACNNSLPLLSKNANAFGRGDKTSLPETCHRNLLSRLLTILYLRGGLDLGFCRLSAAIFTSENKPIRRFNINFRKKDQIYVTSQ